MLDERLGPLEQFTIVTGQFASPASRDGMWAWLSENFDSLIKRLPTFAHGPLVQTSASLCDAAQRVSVEKRLAPKVKTLGTGELELTRALESIDLCVAQKKAHRAAFAELGTLRRP